MAKGAEVRVYRHSANDRFVIIPNDMARNRMGGPKLTSVARCVLVHLLSLPPGWKTSREKLAEDFTEGRDRIGKALTELIDTGFLSRERTNDPETGQVVWVWAVSDEPGTFTQVEPIDAISVDGSRNDEISQENSRSDPSTEMPSTAPQRLDGQSMVSSSYEDVTPSIEENEGSATPATPAADTPPSPAEWARNLVITLNFGSHKRPTHAQAAELAALVESACADHGLSETEVRRHCRAALNEAKRSGVGYLRGALQPDRLPVPAKTADPETDTTASADTEPKSSTESGRRAARELFLNRKGAKSGPENAVEPMGEAEPLAG
ncbi:hypothetical protein [Nocardia wallacei]|uniref:hypothetical protein n=1 Tax=Nocardia wallacei TaxID=480035 RepID=UPI002458E007|nr:hypothetical protein [Nocardia wallacei]